MMELDELAKNGARGNAPPAAMVNSARRRVNVTHTLQRMMTDIFIARGDRFLEIQKTNSFKVDKLDVEYGIEYAEDGEEDRERHGAEDEENKIRNITELESLRYVFPHFHCGTQNKSEGAKKVAYQPGPKIVPTTRNATKFPMGVGLHPAMRWYLEQLAWLRPGDRALGDTQARRGTTWTELALAFTIATGRKLSEPGDTGKLTMQNTMHNFADAARRTAKLRGATVSPGKPERFCRAPTALEYPATPGL